MLTCRACGFESADDAHDCENCLQPLARARSRAVPDLVDEPITDGDPFDSIPSQPVESLCLTTLDDAVVADPKDGVRVILGRDCVVDGLIWTDNVSRVHAEVTRTDGVLQIRDCGSTNGTFVNGVPLTRGESVPLSAGDLVEFARNPPVRMTVGHSRRFMTQGRAGSNDG